MDDLNSYLCATLTPYMNVDNRITLYKMLPSSDEVQLSATERLSDSKIGIVIIPGLTVARESYYPLLAALSGFNVLLFDIRGQGSSGGELDSHWCMKDINFVGAQFREKRALNYLIGIGHSFGGMLLLESSLEADHPYDLRISLAAPVDLTKAAARIPERWTRPAAYLYNLKRGIINSVHRDRVVRHHQSFNLLTFLQDPRIIALRIKNPAAYNTTRLTTKKLTDFVHTIKRPSYLIYPGEDEILK